MLIGIALGVGSFFLLRNGNKAIAPISEGKLVEQAQAFILPISPTTYSPIRNFNVPEPQIHARAALLVDLRSKRILFAKNADAKLPIASIAKLMSALVILERLNLNDIYTVAPEDLNLDGNGADFVQGEQFRGTELFKVMLMKSSNDATSVFVTAAQKQRFDFLALMNKKAGELGMLDTHFADPAGLDDIATYSTATDVATLVRTALSFSSITETLTTAQADAVTITGKVYHLINTDQLLTVIPDILIGKTGNTEGALGTMALAVKINNAEDGLISIILGSQDRFGETKTLIDWGKKAHKWSP